MSLATVAKYKRMKRQVQEMREARREKKEATNSPRRLRKFKDDPVGFTMKILGVKFLTKEQKEFLLHIRDHQTTNIQAAHGVGKSFLMACVILWWVFAVNGIAFTTAPSYDQVKDILWKEVRRLYDLNSEKLGGRRTELTLHFTDENGREYTAKGFSTRNYDSNSFQGKHDQYLLLLQDEADGITPIIDEAFESCLSGSFNRGVRIGNPLTANSAFAKNCALTNIKVPVWNHPNVSWAYQAEVHENGKIIHRLRPEIAAQILKPESDQSAKADPVKPQDQWPEELPRDKIPGAVSVAWIEKVRAKYDEFSTYWVSRVEAEFPGDDTEGIIPLSWLKQARDRYDSNPTFWDNISKLDQFRIGVDVADGVDQHGVSMWRGRVLYKVNTYATSGDREDTVRLAKDIVEPAVDVLGTNYQGAVDRTGVGAGTLGTLLRDGYAFKGCSFGESAKEPKRFKNRKMELFWWLREELSKGTVAIAPLGDIEEEVFEDLTAYKYGINTKDQLVIEDKKAVKARLGRSPDAGESVITAGEVEPTINVEIVNQNEPKLNPYRDPEVVEMQKLTQESLGYGETTFEEANQYFNT